MYELPEDVTEELSMKKSWIHEYSIKNPAVSPRGSVDTTRIMYNA
jgi:hypothetical protein